MKTINGKIARAQVVVELAWSNEEVRRILGASDPKRAFYDVLYSKTPEREDFEGDHNFNQFRVAVGAMLTNQLAEECRLLPENTQ